MIMHTPSNEARQTSVAIARIRITARNKKTLEITIATMKMTPKLMVRVIRRIKTRMRIHKILGMENRNAKRPQGIKAMAVARTKMMAKLETGKRAQKIKILINILSMAIFIIPSTGGT